MKFHDVEQGSEEWDALRLGKVTASKFATFMANDGKALTDPAKDEALKIALEILNGRRAEYSFSNSHMERGHLQEPIARRLYEEERFVTVANGGFFDCGEYGASPDGLIDDDGLVEFKAVTAPTHFANLRRGTFDPAYRWQLVGELDCSGRKWVDFCSFCSDFPEDQQLFVHRITRADVADELKRLDARRAEFLKLVRTTIVTIDPERCWPKAA